MPTLQLRFRRGWLIIFNELTDEQMRHWIEQASDFRYFLAYLTSGRRTGINDPRMNMANTPFTLFARIVDILRYDKYTQGI